MKSIALILTFVSVALWGTLFYQNTQPIESNVSVSESDSNLLEGFALSRPVRVDHAPIPVSIAGKVSGTGAIETPDPVVPVAGLRRMIASEDADCLAWRGVDPVLLTRIRPVLMDSGWINRVKLSPDEGRGYVAWSGPYADEAAASKAAAAVNRAGCRDAQSVWSKDDGWGIRLGVFETADEAASWLKASAERCRIQHPAVRREHAEEDSVWLVFRPLSASENAELRRLLGSALGAPEACPFER